MSPWSVSFVVVHILHQCLFHTYMRGEGRSHIHFGKEILILCSWRFSRYSVPIHWLVNCHMTSNNDTVSRQMPWAGNLVKTLTSNRKQFTVTCEMLTGLTHLLCYITNHLMTGPLGNSEFCFPRVWMFPSTSSWETLRFSGNKIHCSPRDQSLSVYYWQLCGILCGVGSKLGTKQAYEVKSL